VAPGGGTTAPTDALYTPKTDTVDSVMSNYYSQLQSSPIVSSMNHFFTLNASGTCPTFTVPPANLGGHNIWAGLNGNFLCDGTFATILTWIGWVVLAAASYQAAKIALL